MGEFLSKYIEKCKLLWSASTRVFILVFIHVRYVGVQDAPSLATDIDLSQLISWRSMVGRSGGDKGVQDIGDAARLVGQVGKGIGQVLGGGAEGVLRGGGSVLGAAGLKSGQSALNDVGSTVNKGFSAVGSVFGIVGQGVGDVGGGLQNTFSAGFSTLTGSKSQKKVQVCDK
jgi:hypothetical protein